MAKAIANAAVKVGKVIAWFFKGLFSQDVVVDLTNKFAEKILDAATGPKKTKARVITQVNNKEGAGRYLIWAVRQEGCEFISEVLPNSGAIVQPADAGAILITNFDLVSPASETNPPREQWKYARLMPFADLHPLPNDKFPRGAKVYAYYIDINLEAAEIKVEYTARRGDGIPVPLSIEDPHKMNSTQPPWTANSAEPIDDMFTQRKAGQVGVLMAVPGAGEASKTITFSRIVDLSNTISTDIPRWPGDPAVQIEDVATFEKDGYYLRTLTIGEHSGTHMNAPSGFHANGICIDAYSPGSLVVPAVVIDVREKVQDNPDYALTQDDLLAWESENGEVPSGSLVILYTGWQDRWNDPVAFINQDSEGNLHYPGFAPETTQYLLEQREIAGVGIDTHGVDPGLDVNFATNTQVLANNGIVLECLARLDQLPATGATLSLGVLRLEDGSGAPLAVTAFVP